MIVKINNAYVKANENVKDGDIIIFSDAGTEEMGKYGPKMTILVRLPNGDEKKISPNNTSKKAMRKLYGENSDNWVGKEARINIVNMLVQGKMTSVIILSHPNQDTKGNVIEK